MVLLWRHLLSPPLHAALALLLGLEGDSLAVALLESAMPPATMAIVLASYYQLDEAAAGRAVAYSTPVGLAEGLLLYQFTAK